MGSSQLDTRIRINKIVCRGGKLTARSHPADQEAALSNGRGVQRVPGRSSSELQRTVEHSERIGLEAVLEGGEIGSR